MHYLFNMLNFYDKKISLTFFPSALEIFNNVSVVVTVIFPLSSPEIIVLDTPDFSDKASCESPISSRHCLTLNCISFIPPSLFNMLNFSLLYHSFFLLSSMLNNFVDFFIFALYNILNNIGGLYMTIGNLVNSYRLEHDLPMQEFADRCGLSKSYISMLEKNVNPRNNKPIIPTIETYNKIAHGMNLDLDSLLKMLDSTEPVDVSKIETVQIESGYIIPVLGRVAAGIPMTAAEYIIDTEEISKAMANDGEYFGLQVKGDSMEPKISNGDVVIVRKQSDADDGDLVIALVNGDDAVVKRLKKYKDGIALISTNPAYEPMYYSNDEIESKPVEIIGKVKELRAKF